MIADLPSLWAAPQLSAVCEINPRTKPALLPTADVSFVPMSAVDERSGTITGMETRPHLAVSKGYTVFQEGDVLFAKITPCMENGKAAIARGLVNGVGYGSTEFHVLRPNSWVSAEWLFFLVRIPAFRAAAASAFQGAVGQQRVPQSFLETFRIPLPPLSEQRRIVTILQEAEQVRGLSAEAEAKTAILIPALFEHLILAHGRRAAWPTRAVSEVAANKDNAIRTGPFGSDLLHSEFVEEGVPVLGIDNAVSNRFVWAERRFITQAKYQKLKRFRVFPNDVLVTIMGTVGRACIAPSDLPESISTKHLCVITPDHTQVLPMFLWATLLHDPLVRRQAESAGRGAVMEGWNSTIIKSLKFQCPPIEVQSEFTRVANEVLAAEALVSGAKLSDVDFTSSLLANAFTGQLTKSWREGHSDELEVEAQERDVALSPKRVVPLVSRTKGTVTASIGKLTVLRESLSAHQQHTLTTIERKFTGDQSPQWFTADTLARAIEGECRGNVQAVQGHLAVLVARGFVLAVSREQADPQTGEITFGNVYRLPMSDRDEVLTTNSGEAITTNSGEALVANQIPGDFAREREVQRLVARLEKMRMLP